MANEQIKQNYRDIADAIRSKTGENGTMTAEEMPSKIEAIETGITPSGSLDITANGDNIDVTTKATVNVNVPNPSSGTKEIRSEGLSDVTDYAFALVNIPDDPVDCIPNQDDAISNWLNNSSLPARVDPSYGRDDNKLTVYVQVMCTDIDYEEYVEDTLINRLQGDYHIYISGNDAVIVAPVYKHPYANFTTDVFIIFEVGWSEELASEVTQKLQSYADYITAYDLRGTELVRTPRDTLNFRVHAYGGS